MKQIILAVFVNRMVLCHLILPIVIDEMGAEHHDFQFKLIWVRFEPKHERGQLGVVGSVACGHTHPQFLLTLPRIK